MLNFLKKIFGGGGDSGGDGIPAKAQALHDKGRALGSKGDYATAKECFEKAQALAPTWPHPTYDMAFSYLLQADFGKALENYEKVEGVAKDGFFFTNQVAVWTLRGERDGKFAEGTYLAYSQIEWKPNPSEKLEIARQLVEKSPEYTPGWLEVAKLTDSEEEQKEAFERALSLDADQLTGDTLKFTYANYLSETGEKEKARKIFLELAGSEKTVPNVKAFAGINAGALGSE